MGMVHTPRRERGVLNTVSAKPVDFPRTLRPSMQEAPPSTQPTPPPRRRGARTTPRQAPRACEPAEPEKTSSPKKLRGVRTPSRDRSWSSRRDPSALLENRPPFNGPCSPPPKVVASPRTLPTRVCEVGAGNTVLVSHISELRSALKAAYGKLDQLEVERASLKQQLTGVVQQSGTHSAQMRVLEKQLQNVRKQDDSMPALGAAEKLQHKERELNLLRDQLEERDGEIVRLSLERDAAQDVVDELRSETVDLHSSIAQLRQSLCVLQDHNADLAQQNTVLDAALHAREEAASLDEESKARHTFSASDTDIVQSLVAEYRQLQEVMRERDGRMLSLQQKCSSLQDHMPEKELEGPENSRLDMLRAISWLPERQNTREDQRATGLKRQKGEWVRKEELEEVKVKAKRDLVELETELMAIILAMEAEHGASVRARLSPDRQSAATLTPRTGEDSDAIPNIPQDSSLDPIAALSSDPSVRTPFSRTAGSLLTAGWQLGEYQERIETLQRENESLSAKLESAHEHGAREAREEADSQVKFLLHSGRAEISALHDQVTMLTDQLRRVIAAKECAHLLHSKCGSAANFTGQVGYGVEDSGNQFFADEDPSKHVFRAGHAREFPGDSSNADVETMSQEGLFDPSEVCERDSRLIDVYENQDVNFLDAVELAELHKRESDREFFNQNESVQSHVPEMSTSSTNPFGEGP